MRQSLLLPLLVCTAFIVGPYYSESLLYANPLTPPTGDKTMCTFADFSASRKIEFFPASDSIPEKLSPFEIAEIEKMIGSPLPEAYRDYLLTHNGGSYMVYFDGEPLDSCIKIHWPKDNGLFPDIEYVFMDRFLCYQDESYPSESIVYNYNRWKDFLPESTLPIGRGPGGDLFLIGFGPDNAGKIYCWRIVGVNVMEQDDDTVAKAYPGFIADSFIEFLESFVPDDSVD